MSGPQLILKPSYAQKESQDFENGKKVDDTQ